MAGHFNIVLRQQLRLGNRTKTSWVIRRLVLLALAIVILCGAYIALLPAAPVPLPGMDFATVEPEEPEEPECEFEGLGTAEVFSGDFKVPQDDPELLGYVRKCHLIPPSNHPYNLTDPNGDPSAQQGVRKYVSELLENKVNGMYIDCGANDGETISNTLVLERDYGWSGLLIEADPIIFQRLLTKSRMAWAANVCVGIHTYPYQIEMYRHKDWELTTRLAEGGYDKNGPDWTNFTVKCLPLYTMMKALNLEDLDYISMDIEGVELKVLQTLPFDKINVKVFSIETMPNTWDDVRLFMMDKGYAFVKTFRGPLVEDDVFFRTSLINTTLLL